MSETITRTDSPDQPEPQTPWQLLLHDVEQSAHVIAQEITTDAVLGDSITLSVSSYLTQRDKLELLRREFAGADGACSMLRKEADELMRPLGYEPGWGLEQLGEVDAELVVSIIYATEKAGEINKRRTESDALHHQLLERAVDEIALCANIAVLRQVDRFTCSGEAFCVAYIAASILRERTTEDVPLSVGVRTLSEWLQYAVGAKMRATELDMYAHNRVAAAIGRGMGIDSSGALRPALIEAMKKVNSK